MKSLIIIFLFLTSLYSNNFEKSVKSVIDKTNNIMWQDDIEVTQYLENITFAKLYCEELILNGYIDWRVPTIEQLQSIVDVTQKSPTINKLFEYSSKNQYWSNTPFILDKQSYWYIDFNTGVRSYDKNSQTFNIRCIRDIK
jgi:hypothetical protein